MNKEFKKGDKVKVLSSTSGNVPQIHDMIGHVCEVEEQWFPNMIMVWDLKHSENWAFSPYELELVEEHELVKEHKFKVGDKVIGNKKANAMYVFTKEGWIGTVRRVEEDIFYAFGQPLSDYTGEEGFELKYKYFDLYEESRPIIKEHLVKGNKVIVKLSNGRTGVAICHEDDEFDIFEGTKIALERAYGVEKENKEDFKAETKTLEERVKILEEKLERKK